MTSATKRITRIHPEQVLQTLGFEQYHPSRLANTDVSAWRKGGVRVYMSQDDYFWQVTQPGQKLVEGNWADEAFYVWAEVYEKRSKTSKKG
jgi:hypothetical protein